MPSFSKFSPLDPDETDFFTWDFTALVGQVQDDTAASLIGIVEDSGDGHLTIASEFLSGALATATLSTPTLGLTYAVRARITTTFGRTLDLTGTIHCQQS